MVLTLTDLPPDILGQILQKISSRLAQLLTLRLVCSALKTIVDEDKVLWKSVFEWEIEAKHLCYPLNLAPLEDITASQLQRLVEHTAILNSNYERSVLQPLKSRVKISKSVSLVKLIRSRWCLIGSSSETYSELSIWEIQSCSITCLRAQVHIGGRIIDGLVDDDSQRVRVAVTVRSAVPSVEIFDICKNNEERVMIRKLAKIGNAAVVRFLRGDLVGIALYHEEDSFPYLWNWKTNQFAVLTYPICPTLTNPTSFPLEHCSAMFRFNSLLFVITTLHMHIFSLMSVDTCDLSSNSPRFLESFFLYRFYRSATPILTRVIKYNRGFTDFSIIWCLQSASSELKFLDLRIQAGEGDKPVFSVGEVGDDDDLELNPRSPFLTDPDIPYYCVGTAAGAVAFITMEKDEWWLPPRICISRLRLTIDDKASDKPRPAGIDYDRRRYSQLLNEGLPPSSAISCIGFDDGHGIVILGYHSGEFALLFLTSNGSLLRDGILHELPYNTVPSSDYEQNKITDISRDETVISLSSIEDSHPASALIEEVTRFWSESGKLLPATPGWSRDWRAFTQTRDWIDPVPLQLSGLAMYKDLPIVVCLRQRLRKYGTIIPVMYDTEDHSHILFRAKERLFICRSDFAKLEDFDENFELGILPLSYSDFLALDAEASVTLLSDDGVNTNLNRWHEERTYIFRINLAMLLREVLKYLRRDAQNDEQAMGILERWTDVDWDRYFNEKRFPPSSTELG